MSRKTVEKQLAGLPEPVLDDPDNPEWIEEDFARAKPASEILPPEVLAAFPRTRGVQKTPTKRPVSIRLSQRVLDYYKAQGAGWQTRMNADLEDLIKRRA